MAAVDLELIRHFVALQRTGSFSLAARSLGVPRSSVSRAIATLETQLDLRLFHRTTRKVSITAAGTALFERIHPAFVALDRSLREAPERDDVPTGSLRITSTVDLSAIVLGEVVARFVRRYPGVRVESHSSNQLVDLVGQGFDLALRMAPRKRLGDSSLVARKVGTVQLQLFAAPAYLKERGTPRSVAALRGHEWVAFKDAVSIADDRRLARAMLERARIVCDDMFFARETLKAGAGIGMLPSFLAEAEVAAGSLKRVLPSWSAFTGTIFLVQPSARHVPRKVTAFREILTELLERRPLAEAP